MNYKYIEQLIERYFACETTLQEEQILRSFFAQDDVPNHLIEYADIFRYELAARDNHLDEEFDAKMLNLIAHEEGLKTSNVVAMRSRFTPLFKAAAIVAMVLTIGGAAEKSIGESPADAVEDVTAINPYIKKDNISAAIKVKDNTQAGLSTVVGNDSLLIDNKD